MKSLPTDLIVTLYMYIWWKLLAYMVSSDFQNCRYSYDRWHQRSTPNLIHMGSGLWRVLWSTVLLNCKSTFQSSQRCIQRHKRDHIWRGLHRCVASCLVNTPFDNSFLICSQAFFPMRPFSVALSTLKEQLQVSECRNGIEHCCCRRSAHVFFAHVHSMIS